MATDRLCEYEGCTEPYTSVDAAFGFVCGLHRDPVKVTMMDTGRNLRDVDPLEMSDGELDASMGDLLKVVAAKQSDAWAAQRDAAAWKAYAEYLGTVVYQNGDDFYEEARRRGITT